jgi:hypothetical protein
MSNIKIGWASRDVSTDKPINISGQFYIRISKGVMDPVTVNALVIDDGNDLVIFLSADISVARSGLLDMIRNKVRKQNPQIPVEKILMNATHTHTAPSHHSDGLWKDENSDKILYEGKEILSSDDYRDFLAERAKEAICEAYENRKPGGISYGYGYAVVAHSRRVVYFDDLSKREGSKADSLHHIHGHAAMYGNTKDENFSHYEAGADHFINLLYTFDKDGKLTGAIINVPCPSQNSEFEEMISADYWNDVRVALRKKYGDIFILTQCAAAGDLSPRILHYGKAQERRFRLKYGEGANKGEFAARKDIAERIAVAFTEVYEWARNDIKTELPINHIVKTVMLSKRIVTDEEYEYAKKELEELNKVQYKAEGTPEEKLNFNSKLMAGKNRFKRVVKRYEEQKENPKLPMELHVLRIGDVAFASNQFELYMDYQHRIQARSPFEQTFIIQLAAQPGLDGGRYLATERGVWGKGYSASMFCNIVSPKGGQELVDETVKLLKEIN